MKSRTFALPYLAHTLWEVKNTCCSQYGLGKKTILFPESFYKSLFIFEHSKMKSVTEKGFPSSLHYAVTRGKGNFSFRFSQLLRVIPKPTFRPAPTPFTSFTDLYQIKKMISLLKTRLNFWFCYHPVSKTEAWKKFADIVEKQSRWKKTALNKTAVHAKALNKTGTGVILTAAWSGGSGKKVARQERKILHFPPCQFIL